MTEQSANDPEIKEVFAWFGRAIYMANVVEVELAHTLLQIDFMTKVRDNFVRSKAKNFDRKKYEKDFDNFLKEQFSKTMGDLKKEVAKVSDFDEKLNWKTVLFAAKAGLLPVP